MAESVTEVVYDSVVLSSGKRAWNGIEVMRALLPFHEMRVPALASHTVVLNLGRPYKLRGAIDGRVHEGDFRKGSAKVVSAGVPSEWNWRSEGQLDVLHLSLTAAFAEGVALETGVDPDRLEILNGVGLRDPRIEQVGASLLSELRTGGLGGRLFAESLTNVLAVHLLRHHSSLGRGAVRRAAREDAAGGPNGRALKRATDYVGDNLASDLSLGGIARAANLSPRHLSRLFKESTGLSPHQYVIRRRVERAKSLLGSTDLTVGEVARMCGFSHQSHLAFHARRLLGVPPAALRR